MALPVSPELDHTKALFLPGGGGVEDSVVGLAVTRKRAPQHVGRAQQASTAVRVFHRDQMPSFNGAECHLHHHVSTDTVVDNTDPEACVVRVRALLERYERNLAAAFSSLIPKDKQSSSLQEVTLTQDELFRGLVSKFGVTEDVSASVSRILDNATNGAGIDLPSFCQELCRTSSRLRDFHGSLDNGTLTPTPDSLETKGKGYHAKATAFFSDHQRSSLHMSTNLPVARHNTPNGDREVTHNSASPSFIQEHGFGYVNPDKTRTSTPHRPASLNDHHEETFATRRRLGYVETHCQQVGQTGEMRYNPITHKGGRPEDKLPWYSGEQTSALKTKLRHQGSTPYGSELTPPSANVQSQSPSSGKWLRAQGPPPPSL